MIPSATDKAVAGARTWRSAVRAWGLEGNDRLTASVGLVLFVLLAVEAWTTLSLSSYLSLHMFLGFVLLTPVALKLASTGWRAVRYYAGSRQYRLAGPPKLSMRLLAPLLVASTLALFGSGVALVVVGHGRGWLQTVHAASFGVWGAVMIVHVVVYVPHAFRLGTSDWRRKAERIVPGALVRRALLVGAVLAGVIIALATYPAQHAFHSRAHDSRDVAASRKTLTPARLSGRWTLPSQTHTRPTAILTTMKRSMTGGPDVDSR